MVKRMISLLTCFTFMLTLNIIANPPNVSAQNALMSERIQRIAGDNRYDTAGLTATYGWPQTSEYAVIANGEDFPDALCSAPLAKKYQAPILLTEKNSLSPQVKEQLKRLKTAKVFLIGGTRVISSNIENELEQMGIEVSRIAGNDRYETSLNIALQLGPIEHAVLATGENFPDALSIASIAGIKQMPILLAEKNKISPSIETYLANAKPSTVYLVGGLDAISDSVKNMLPNTKRLSGENRYQTNASVINEFKNELQTETAYMATGENFPDALAGSALASQTNGFIVLVGSSMDPSTKELMENYFTSTKNVILFGGYRVVDASALKLRNKSTTYNNNEYGFSLQLPDDWAGHYRVEEYKLNEEAMFLFYYNVKNEDYEILWISVHPDSEVKVDSHGYYGLLKKITSDNGLTYLWGVPTGLHKGLDPIEQHLDEFNIIKSKIDQTEEIIDSFKLK